MSSSIWPDVLISSWGFTTSTYRAVSGVINTDIFVKVRNNTEVSLQTRSEKIGTTIYPSKIGVEHLPEALALEQSDLVKGLIDILEEKTSTHTDSSAITESLEQIARNMRLYASLSRVKHVLVDEKADEYHLEFIGFTDTKDFNKEVAGIYDIGNVEWLLTKRFIKSPRGSAYEVPLRYNESLSLLRNVMNQLVRAVIERCMEVSTMWCLDKQYVGRPTQTGIGSSSDHNISIMILDGINSGLKSPFEMLLQDWCLLKMTKGLPDPPNVSSVVSEVVELVLNSSKLKFKDQSNMMSHIHGMSKANADLRPNINNIQGFTGIRLFQEYSFYKLYSFEDALPKNSHFMTKDLEDQFRVRGVVETWKEPISQQYQTMVLELCENLKKASDVQFKVFLDPKSALRERILARLISEPFLGSSGRRKERNTKARAILRAYVRICRIESALMAVWARRGLEAGFEKIAEVIARKKWQEGIIKQEQFRNVVCKAKNSLAIQELRGFVSNIKGLHKMVRLLRKMRYVEKLALQTHGFLMIKKIGNARAMQKKNLITGLGMLRNLMNHRLAANLSGGMSSLKAKLWQHRKLAIVLKQLERSLLAKLKQSLVQMVSNSQNYQANERKSMLERQSVQALRRNYLLNNLLFIFKLNSAKNENINQRAGFEAIKSRNQAKVRREQAVTLLCTTTRRIQASHTLQHLRHTTQASAQHEHRTKTLKLGFHFLEMYIEQKSVKRAMQTVKTAAVAVCLVDRGLEVLRRVVEGRQCAVAFGRLKGLMDLKRGFVKLHNLVRYQHLNQRAAYGRELLEKMEMISLQKLQAIRSKLRQGVAVLNRLVLASAFKQLVIPRSQLFLKSVRRGAVSLEIFFLKGKKKSFQSGLLCLHKNMIKGRLDAQERRRKVKARAAIVIQSSWKMRRARTLYLTIRWAARLIQQRVRKFLQRVRQIRELQMRALNQGQHHLQRQRMTQMRQTAMMKVKGLLGAPKNPDFEVEVEPSGLLLQPNMRKTQQSKYQSRDPHMVSISQLDDTLKHRIHQHNITSGPETDRDLSSSRLHKVSQKSNHPHDLSGVSISTSSISTKNPLGMMRLNKDSNERERIKFMKEKVIRNHIETAKQKLHLEEQEWSGYVGNPRKQDEPQLELHVGKQASRMISPMQKENRDPKNMRIAGPNTLQVSKAWNAEKSLTDYAKSTRAPLDTTGRAQEAFIPTSMHKTPGRAELEQLQHYRESLHDKLQSAKVKVQSIRRTQRYYKPDSTEDEAETSRDRSYY